MVKQVTKKIKLNRLDPPEIASRMEIDTDAVKSLADNIKEVGLLNPLLVREVDGRFEIVAGHRRYLACKSLGLPEIYCTIKVMTDLEAALARASENRDRVDLSAIEEATEYQQLVDIHGLSVDEVGRRMGKSPGVVKRRLNLLKMQPAIQKAVHAKKISTGVAEEFNRLHDAGKIDYYLGYAIDHGITVSVARSWVNDEKKAERLQGRDVEGTGGVATPLEEAPVYLSCDVCHGPEDLRKMQNLRVCNSCVGLIREGLKLVNQS